MCFFFIIQFFNKTLPKGTKVNPLATFRFRSTFYKFYGGFCAMLAVVFPYVSLVVFGQGTVRKPAT
jgi:hypothetical protein